MNGVNTSAWKTRLRAYGKVRADYRAVILMVLFAIVIQGALYARPHLVASGLESAVAGTSTSEQAVTATGWVFAEVAIAVALILLILVYRRLPEWLQSIGKRAVLVAAAMYLGAVTAAADNFLAGIALVVGIYACLGIIDELDLYWVVNDVFVLGVAIWIAAWLGIVTSPAFIGVGLVGLSVYDHYFADRKRWMFTLVKPVLKARLPVLFFLPESWRFDWDSLVEDVSNEDETGGGFGIGTADLILPAAFVASLAPTGVGVGPSVLLGSVVIGILVACLRLSWKMETEGDGAGLPSLASGTLGGWAVGTVLVVVLV